MPTGSTVTLAGSATGPWGNNVTWAWTQVDGASSTTEVTSGAVTFDDASSAAPSFTAPSSVTALHFMLVATPVPGAAKGTAASEPDWVTVSTNGVPEFKGELNDRTIFQGVELSLQVPENAFVDPEGDAITYSATLQDGAALPDWLTFTPSTRTFSGTPQEATDVGIISVKLIATDSNGGSGSKTFSIEVGSNNTCFRTPQVLDAILTAITGSSAISGCFSVTPAQLAAITSLTVSGQNALTKLKAGDFDGLTALHTLNLSGNALASPLPGDIFVPLDKLTTLDLGGNPGAPFTPVANAGADQSVSGGARATLQGQASGAWGDKVTWAWTQVDGASSTTPVAEGGVTLTGATSATPSFIAPATASDLPLHFMLVVTPTLGTGKGIAASAPDRVTVTVTSNNVPIAADSSVTTSEDTAHTFAAGDFSFADADFGDQLASVTLLTLPAVGELTLDGAQTTVGQVLARADIDADKLIFTPVAGASGSPYASFTFRVGDGASDSVAAYTMTIDVAAVNDAPTLENAIPDQEAMLGMAFSYSFPSDTFADVDGGDTLAYTATKTDGGALPAWLTFTSGTRSFSGTPQIADAGRLSVQVTASDGNGGSVSDSFELSVAVTDVCTRTREVSAAIVAAVNGVSDCVAVTPAHLAAITELRMFNKRISSLQASDFKGLTNLTDLNLGLNRLTSLPAGIFAGLTRLEILLLNNNRLTSLPAGIFAGLTRLKILRLDNNSLTSLPVGIFAGLTRLEILRLNNNSLTSLPVGILDGLIRLTELVLGGNRLTALPAGILDGLTNLTDLSLISNRLTSLPTGIFAALTNLTVLELGSNRLTALPANVFATLTKLTYLNLGGNRLTPLSADLFDGLTNMEVLLLDNMGLTSLPEDLFDGMSKLTRLELYSNGLTSLPAGVFHELKRLVVLRLGSNGLASLPEGIFDGLKRLRILHLGSNRLTSLPEGIFNGLTELDTLFLSDNRLTALPEGLFKGLPLAGFAALQGNPGAPFRPTISTAANRLARRGAEVELTASASGAWGDDVTWGWTQVDGADSNTAVGSGGVTLAGASSATVSFTAPNAVTNLYFRLLTTPKSGARAGAARSEPVWVTVAVGEGNTPPRVANPIPTRAALPGTEFSYQLPANTFEDADGDALVHAATRTDTNALPTWLKFDRATRIFSGSVPSTYTGKLLVRVTATDVNGGSVYDDFDIAAAETDVCNRTPQVRDAITAAVPDSNDCVVLTSAQLAAISVLNLSRKGMTSLRTGDFAGLSGLTELSLNDNALTTLPADIFTPLAALTRLTLTNINLTELSAGVFTALTQLTFLEVGGNGNLTELPAGIFDGLTALRALSLSDNRLSSLPVGIFDELTELRVLSLTNNALTALPADIFVPLDKLSSLNLKGNPGVPFTPTADAGADRVVATGAAVTLSGGVTGAWGERVTWAWTQVDGTSSTTPVTGGVTLSDLNSAAPSFTAPGSASTLYFRLIATPVSGAVNGAAASAPDWITLTVNTVPRLATPIPDQAATPDRMFSYAFPPDTFTDADGDALTYTATRVPRNPNAGGEDEEALPAWLTFTADARTFAGTPRSADAGLLRVRVTASDGTDSVSDSFDIVVAATDVCVRTPAVRDAITGAVSAAISGTATCTDLTPADLVRITRLDISGSNLASLRAGDFAGLTGLTTLDLSGNSLSALPADIFAALTGLGTLRLDGNPGASFRPVADAGPDQSVATGAAVTLAGAVSGAWGGNVTWAWTQVTGARSNTPVSSGVTLSDLNGAAPSFTAPSSASTLYFRLVATPVPGAVNGAAASNPDWVIVGAGNTPPRVENPMPDQRAKAGMAFSYVFAQDSFADADGDPLTYTATAADGDPLPTWLTFTASARSFSGTPSLADGGELSVTVTARDGNGGSVDDTFTLAVALTDVCTRTSEVRDAITAAVAGVSDCAAVTSAHLAGITSLDISSSSLASLRADDFAGLTGLTTLDLSDNGLTALPANIFAPLSALTTLDLSGNSGAPFSPVANAGANRQVVVRSGVSLEASATGAWGGKATWAWTQVDAANSDTAVTSGGVTLDDASSATPSFTAPISASTLHFRLVATPVTGAGEGAASASAWVTITTSHRPSVGNRLLDQVAVPGTEFTYVVPDNAFTDAEGDTLTYTATGADDAPLPTWLRFAADTRTFSGTPRAADADRFSVQVSVTDGSGSASDSFEILVAATDVCSRTLAVRDAILGAVPGTRDCADLTPVQLAAITTLNIANRGLASLRTGDLDGLTGLMTLSLRGNTLNALPADLFSPLTALTALDLGGNPGAPFSPVANAGGDQSVLVGGQVMLDATATGAWGNRVTWRWTQVTGARSMTAVTGGVTLDDASSATPSFTAPNTATDLHFMLVATPVPTPAARSGTAVSAPDWVTVTLSDGSTPALLFSDAPLELDEGGSGSYRVRLATRPSADVTVSIDGTVGTDLTLDADGSTTGNQSTLVFTRDNWGMARRVTVTAGEDSDTTDDAAMLRHSASGGGYDALGGEVAVSVTDNDRPRLLLVPAALNLNEGADGSYTVRLATRPSTDVTVAISGTDGTDVTLDTDPDTDGDQDTLTFAPADWEQPQTVTVSAGQDDDSASDRLTLSHTASGGDYDAVSGEVAVMVGDDDAPRLLLSNTAFTLNEGDSDSYAVRLATRPSADVTVTIGGTDGTDVTLDTDPDMEGNQNTLTFARADWDQPQTVRVTAGEDGDATDDLVTLSHRAAGGEYAAVTASVALRVSDNERGLLFTPTSLTLDEGSSGSYTVRLATRPDADVIVTIGGTDGTDVTVDTDTQQTGDQNTLSFTRDNWSLAQSVAVRAAQDGNAVDDEVTLLHSAVGGSYASVSGSLPVTVDDDETQPAAPIRDICGRTREVIDAILAHSRISATTCGSVNSVQLGRITQFGIQNKNSLTTLEVGDFVGLTGLTHLRLDRNSLTALPAGIFDPLPELRVLDLADNDLASLPAGVFDALDKLQNLSLSDNNLSALPDNIFALLPSLVGLSFNGNPGAPFRPTATVAAARNAPTGTHVTLAGRASGPWGERVTWAWTQVQGASSTTAVTEGGVTLDDASSATPSFTAPNTATDLHFMLVATPRSGVRNGVVASTPARVTVTVGTAPLLANPMPDQRAFTGRPFRYRVSPDTFVDSPDDTLTYRASKADGGALPTWLAFNPAARTFSGTPQSTDTGTISVQVTVSDVAGGSVSDVFDIQVLAASLCDRTSAVRDAITAAVTGVSDCRDLTAAQLAGITALDLSGRSLASLRASDFAGLTGLTSLDLGSNSLASLPERIFAQLGALSTLDLSGNPGAPFRPAVNAGADQSVASGVTVTLRAQASGAWGERVAWQWTQVTAAGVTTPVTGGVTLRGAASASASFIAPGTTSERHLHFMLVATPASGADKGAAASAPDWVTVTVLEGNAPTAADSAVTLFEDSAHTFTAADFSFADADFGDRLESVTLVTVETAGDLTLDNAPVTAGQMISRADIDAGKLAFTPAASANGSPYASFTFRVGDGQSDSAAAYTMNIIVTAVNDVPKLVKEIPDQSAQVGVAFSYDIPADTFADVDGDALTYVASRVGGGTLPLWLRFTAATGTFHGTASEASLGTVSVKLTALDAGRARVSDSFDIVVKRTNVCSRTSQVRDAIVAEVNNVSDCADVAGAQLAAIKNLSLVGKGLASLKTGDFDGLTGLGALRMTSNPSLTSLPVGIFDDLIELTILDFSLSGVATLPESIFDRLTKLRVLTVGGNPLTSLPAGIFDKLTDLRELDLGATKLTSLPADIFDELKKLSRLRLDDSSGLTSLPAGIFDELTGLTQLALGANKLSSLPDNIFARLTALTELNLDSNPGAPFKPTVTVGADQLVAVGTEVTLAGVTSGPWGGNITWAWTQVDGTSSTTEVTSGGVTLTGASSATASFTAPDTADELHFMLELTPVPGTTGEVGISVSDPAWVTVTVNAPPRVANTLLPQGAQPGVAFSYTFPENTFTDSPGDTLTYTASAQGGAALPTWLEFNAATRTFSGTPPNDYDGSLTVTVVASDGKGGSVSDFFDLLRTPTDVCNRTLIVRRVISATVPSALGNCAVVTPEQLARITSLDMSRKTLNVQFNRARLERLRAGDFNGLTGLKTLNLSNNSLTELPDDIFAPLTALTNLNLTNNPGASFRPVVDAGPDRSVLPGAAVRLPPAQVSGPWGERVAWKWTQVTAAGVTTPVSGGVKLTGATDASVSFTAPSTPGDVHLMLRAEPASGVRFGALFSAPDWVTVTANTAPVLANALPDQTAIAGTAFLHRLAEDSFTDADSSDRLTYRAQRADGSALPGWLIFNTAIRTFSGTPQLADTGTLSIKVTARDGNGGLVSDVFDIRVAGTDVCTRTSEVRAAILAAVTEVSDCADLTPTQVAAISSLDVSDHGSGLTSLRTGDLEGLTGLTELDLSGNRLASLPADVFDELAALTSLDLSNNSLASTSLPEGLFAPLASLATLRLAGNPGAPFAPTVNAGDDRGAPTGTLVTLAARVTGPWGERVTWAWTQVDGASSTTPVTGGVTLADSDSASASFTTPNASGALHFMLVVTPATGAVNGAASVRDWVTVDSMGVCGRTPQVRDAILAAVTGVSNCADLTPAQLAGITSLNVSGHGSGLVSLRAGDFGGLSGLTQLYLNNNGLTALPTGIFAGLSKLTVLRLDRNALSPSGLPAGVFAPLAGLTRLELASNALSSALPDGIFAPLTALTALDLAGNSGAPFKPTADAGADQQVSYGVKVTLAGSATGAWGGNVGWQWTQVDGASSNTAAADAVTLADAATASPSFTAPGTAASLHFRVVVTPLSGVGKGAAASAASWVTVQAGNTVPTLRKAIPDAFVVPGMAFSYSFPENTFADADGDPLAYTAAKSDGSALPDWLKFEQDDAPRTFSGTVPSTFIDTLSVKVSASDGTATVSDTFDIGVKLPGVCSRTRQVRDAIVAAVDGVSDCADVTDTQLTGITNLRFVGNRLASLRVGDFDGLTRLGALRMTSNPSLTSLPVGIFDDLIKLTILDFSLSGVATLPEGIFDQLIKLRVLAVGGSPLTSLPAGIFDKLTDMNELDLGATKLTSLPADIFDELTKMVRLRLDGNSRLTSLPVGILDELGKLTDLNLENTPLTSLPEGLLEKTTSLSALNLSNIPAAPFKPTANAGDDRAVPVGATATLAGEASGAWGERVTWAWTQVDAPSSTTAVTSGVTLADASSANPSFTAPDTVGDLHFMLIVTPLPPPGAVLVSGVAASSPDWVTITTSTVPTVANPLPDQQATPGVAFSYAFPDNTFADSPGDTLTYAATRADGTDLPAWLSFDAATRSFSGTAQLSDAGLLSLKVTATDTSGASVSDTFDLLVSRINVCNRTSQVRDAIVSAVPGVRRCASLTATQLAAITTLNLANSGIESLKAGDFAGLGGLQTLNLSSTSMSSPNSLTSLPEGIFAPLTALTSLNLSGNPGAPFKLTARIISADRTVAGDTLVELSARVTGPWGGNVIWAWTQVDGDESTTEVGEGGVTLAGADKATASFTAPDMDATLYFTLQAAPKSGIGLGVEADEVRRAKVTVGDGNNAPTVASPIPDQVAIPGAMFSYAFPANTFSDADANDTLSYAAILGDGSELPSWLTFDDGERSFSGTVSATFSGRLAVRVVAKDSSGGSVSDVFDIVASETDVCNRTPAVRDAIIAATAGISDCVDVTLSGLAGIASLTIANVGASGSLVVGDFAGLTGLGALTLNAAGLTALPGGIFDALTALTSLDLGGNSLASLPDDIFAALTRLDTLNLDGNPASFKPSVNAGSDQNARTGMMIELDATVSGAWGGNVIWAWTQVDGASSNTAVDNPLALTGGNSASVSFTAPDTPENLHFRLIATPMSGIGMGAAASDPDWVTVSMALASPAGLELKANTLLDTGFTVQWEAVESATGYTATAAEDGRTPVQGEVTGVEATFTGLSDDTEYTVSVTASDDGGDYVDSAAATTTVTTREIPKVRRARVGNALLDLEGEYGLNDKFQVELIFSSDVKFTGVQANNPPTVVIDVGGERRIAKFDTAGSGRANAFQGFLYFVQSGDFDTDGVELLAQSIKLNGARIVSGNPALDADPGIEAQPLRQLNVNPDIDNGIRTLNGGPGLRYSSPPATLTVNTPMPAMTVRLVNSDANPAPTFSYAVTSGTLPRGLRLNETTGAITGTPSEASDTETQVTVTGTTGTDPDTTSYGTEVTFPPVGKEILAKPQNLALEEGALASMFFTVTWDAVANATDYTASAVADGGEPVAGVVVGTEATFSGLTMNTEYRVSVVATAAANFLDSEATELTVTTAFDAALSYPPPPATLTTSVEITPLTPTLERFVDPDAATYSVSPALPTGLELDAASGEISGAPTMATGSRTMVTVTASAGSGDTVQSATKDIDFPAVAKGTLGSPTHLAPKAGTLTETAFTLIWDAVANAAPVTRRRRPMPMAVRRLSAG